MSISIEVPLAEMEMFRGRLKTKLDDVMRAIGRRLQREGKSLLEGELGRYQTGKLAETFRASLGVSTGDFLTALISVGPSLDEFGHNYARDVFHGAEPHVIVPKDPKGWLHWTRDGQEHFAKKVMHPGQRARTDIVEALRALAVQIGLEELLMLEFV